MKQRVIRGIALLMLAALLCTGANILAFKVDTKTMRDNVWQGCLMLGEQKSHPQTVGGFLSAQLDNYTGILILKTAGYVGPQSLMEKAFGGYRVDMPKADGETAWDAYCNYEFGELAPDGSLYGYSRYWHGYTLPLRLALCVLDVANLQMVLYFAQLLLFIYVLQLMKGRGAGALIPGFFLAYFLIMPFSSSICLQYVPVTMLMLGACVCVLKWNASISRSVTMPAFYALLGLLTNYFDLLTFPMVSLCFPLVMDLALRMRQEERGANLFIHTAACGCAWALGYGGMWALKWALDTLVFGPEILNNIFTQIGLRASDNGGEISRFAVLMQNLSVMLGKRSYLLLIGLSGLATLAPAARALKRRSLRINARALNLLLPAAACCMWILMMANHAHDHTYFTYRNLAPAVFAGYAFIACALAAKEDDRA